jgi:hypothetical protein
MASGVDPVAGLTLSQPLEKTEVVIASIPMLDVIFRG